MPVEAAATPGALLPIVQSSGRMVVYSTDITLLVAGGQDSTLRAWQGSDAKSLFAHAPAA